MSDQHGATQTWRRLRKAGVGTLLGKLRLRRTSHIDVLTMDRAAGWVQSNHSDPAEVAIFIDGDVALRLRADLPRNDVAQAGYGHFECGFDTEMPVQLRDGRKHLVELRAGVDGPLLTGGSLTIAADPARAADFAALIRSHKRAIEGLAMVAKTKTMITGWATGCDHVLVSIDNGTPIPVSIDRPVPGLGQGRIAGFEFRLPRDYIDGAVHEIAVTGPDGTALSGTPLSICVATTVPVISIAQRIGRDITFEARDIAGDPYEQGFVISADTQILKTTHEGAFLSCEIPDGARSLTVSLADGEVLARYALQTTTPHGWNFPAPLGSFDGLDQAAFDRAWRAFHTFVDAPDARFDALWYGFTYGVTEQNALSHYIETGAVSGHGPGPFFNEALMRQLHPELETAIRDGKLPCAFALELSGVLKPFASMPSLTEHQQAYLTQELREECEIWDGPTQASDRPAQTSDNAPSAFETSPDLPTSHGQKTIYATWLDRLDASLQERRAITDDEVRLHRMVCSTPLTDAPLVSIIMPTYNRAFTIGEAIQSVLDQTYQNWELIVCDDDSTDKTADVVRAFNDQRIRYIKFAKSNGAATRNKGLRQARGSIIAYLDSDNIWHPMFLGMMLRALQSNPSLAIAYCAYLDTETVGAKVNLQSISRPSFRPIALVGRNFMDLNTIVHHRKVYDRLGGFDNDLPRLQDWDLALRYTSIFRPKYVDHIGVYYRRNVAWGQVTHLFMQSNAQGTVKEKTEKRLTTAHERQVLNWPRKPDVTVFCATTETGSAHCADALARALSACAQVTQICIRDDDQDRSLSPPPVDWHRIDVPKSLCADLERLGHALGSMLGARPVFTVGLRSRQLLHIPDLDPTCTFALGRSDHRSAHGTVLRCLSDQDDEIYLGALPISLPDIALDDLSDHALLWPQAGHKDVAGLIAKSSKPRPDTVIVAPASKAQPWLAVKGNEVHNIDLADGFGVPAALAQVKIAISMSPIHQLGPFELGLLTTLQSRGVPLAVQRRGPDDGFALQWLEFGAAYELKSTDLHWGLEKSVKLIGDPGAYNRIAQRGQIAHSATIHQALITERLADTVWRLAFRAQKRAERQ